MLSASLVLYDEIDHSVELMTRYVIIEFRTLKKATYSFASPSVELVCF